MLTHSDTIMKLSIILFFSRRAGCEIHVFIDLTGRPRRASKLNFHLHLPKTFSQMMAASWKSSWSCKVWKVGYRY